MTPVEARQRPRPRLCFPESSIHFPDLMAVLADFVNDLIALIPEDGSRISNDQIRAPLE